MRSSERLTVAINVDRSASEPLHEQLVRQLTAAVESGLLAAGTRVPSTRTLAEQLTVSRGVALAAYEILLAQGVIEGRTGSGSYVSARRTRVAPPARSVERRTTVVGQVAVAACDAGEPGQTGPALVDLTPGQPETDGFPLREWRAAWRHASYQPPPFADQSPWGLPGLRQAVGEHLRRTRGLSSAEHQIVITSGLVHGLRTVLDAIDTTDVRVAVEDPCPRSQRTAIGAAPIAVPADGQGIRVDAIGTACRAVVTTPDGPEPFGHVLSAARRRELADWARDGDRWVVELASDRTIRPAASALPRLLDLAGTRAVVVGDLSTVFTPTLRLGYLLVPHELVERFARYGAAAFTPPSPVTQLAMAHLLTGGTVERRIHRLGRILDRQRALVLGMLEPGVTVVDQRGVGAAVLHLPAWLDSARLSRDLRARGVRVPTLASWYPAGRPAPNGLVLGYGHLPDSTLRQALALLHATLATARRRARQAQSSRARSVATQPWYPCAGPASAAGGRSSRAAAPLPGAA